MDIGHFTVVGKILFATFRLYSDNLTAFQLYSDNLQPEEDEMSLTNDRLQVCWFSDSTPFLIPFGS